MTDEEKGIVVLYGGGIDSTTLLGHLATDPEGITDPKGIYQLAPNDIHVVHFDYGQKASVYERACAYYFAELFGVVNRGSGKPNVYGISVDPFIFGSSDIMKDAGRLSDTPSRNVVEGRNLLFIAHAAVLASKLGVANVAVGFHHEPEGAPFPDASRLFLSSVNHTMRAGMNHPVGIIAPFKYLTRKGIFKAALKIHADILTKAHTCYEAVSGGCGKCAHCVTKAQLLDEISQEDAYLALRARVDL